MQRWRCWKRWWSLRHTAAGATRAARAPRSGLGQRRRDGRRARGRKGGARAAQNGGGGTVVRLRRAGARKGGCPWTRPRRDATALQVAQRCGAEARCGVLARARLRPSGPSAA